VYWGYKEHGGGANDAEGVAGSGKQCQLHLVEHTEFIDESSHRPFHSSQNYMKRVSNTKLISKGKIAYLNIDQLSVPESFPDATKFPDKFVVDCFVLCVDASVEFTEDCRQRKFLVKFIPELLKAKKPCIAVLTKCDEAAPENMKTISEFLGKQKKLQQPFFEVSSKLNINVMAALLTAANVGNAKVGPAKPKTLTFSEGMKIHEEHVSTVTESLTNLLNNVAKEFSILPKEVIELVKITKEGQEYILLLGTHSCKAAIRRHLNRLRQAATDQRQGELMKKLRDVLRFLVPVLKSEPPPSSTQETLEKGVEEILTLLHSHEKFSEFFITESGNESFLMSSSTSITFSPPPNSSNQMTSGSSLMSVSSSRSFRAPQWNSDDVLKKVEERIPWCFLQINEVKALLGNYVTEARQRALDSKLLDSIEIALHKVEDRILPGTPMEELLTLGSCTSEAERVSDRESLSKVYNAYMRQLDTKYGEKLEELFLEHPELFLTLSAPDVDPMKESMEKLKKIHEVLKDYEHYRALDGRQQFRQNALMKYNALFVAKSGTLIEDPLMPALAEQSFKLKDICPYSSNTSDDEEDLDREDGSNTVSKFRWLLDPSDSCIQIALVGQLDNLGKLRQDIKGQCSESGRIDLGNKTFYLIMELFEDFNALRDANYVPQAGVVLLDSTSSVEKFELSANELLTADPGAGSMQPFFGMPLVAVALGEEYMKSKSPELQRVMKITNKLQSGLICQPKLKVLARLLNPAVAKKLVNFLMSIITKTTAILQPVFTPGLTEIQLLVCTLPKDPYNTSDIAGLWAGQPLSWYHKEQNSHVFQVCLPERAAPVHITLKAESMLNVSKIRPLTTGTNSTLHGYILFYSTARLASFRTVKHLVENVLWMIPTLVVAVPPSNGTDPSKVGSKDLVEKGRLLVSSRENTKFFLLDRDSWHGGCLNFFYTLCWDKRFSSTNTQKTRSGMRSTLKRDLPQLPPRPDRCDSPDSPTLRLRQASMNRHSVNFGGSLPQPLSMSLPQKGDVPEIAPTHSDSDEEKPSGEASVKIHMPEGGYCTVPRSPNPGAFQQKHNDQTGDLEEEAQYTLPTEVVGKPTPAAIKAMSFPHSVALQQQMSSELTQDSDYAEPINSIRFPAKKNNFSKPPPPKNRSPSSGRSKVKSPSSTQRQQGPTSQMDIGGGEMYESVSDTTRSHPSQPEMGPDNFYSPVVKKPHPAERPPPPIPELYTAVVKNPQTATPPSPPPEDPGELYTAVVKKPTQQTEPPLDPNELYAPVIKKPQQGKPPPPPPTGPEELYAAVIKKPKSPDPVDDSDNLYAEVIKPKKTGPPPKAPPPETKPKPKPKPKVAKKPEPPSPIKVPASNSYEPLYAEPEMQANASTKPTAPSTTPPASSPSLALRSPSIAQSSSASPSPKSKRKPFFSRSKRKEDTKPTPPSSPGLLLAQEAAKKASSLPRDLSSLSSSKDSPPQLSPTDVDSGVYDHGDDETIPEVPSRPDDFGFDDDDEPPPVPARHYLSDFESDNEDETVDEVLEEDEDKMLKTIYDCLERAGGHSKETSQLYDTLEQYQKFRLQEKKEQSSDYSEVVGKCKEPVDQMQENEGLYATVEEAVTQARRHVSPVRDSPVRELSAKERKQNLKIMKQAAKAMERQKKLEEKKRKREEEQMRKEEEKKKKAEAKMRKSSKKRTTSIKQKKTIMEEVKDIYFGVPVDSIVSPDSPVPDFILKCAQVIEVEGVDTVGIYRLSGKHDDVKLIQEKYEQDHNLDLGSLDLDVTSTSSAMKAFFKMLPDPLIPDNITQEVLTVIGTPASEHDEKLANILLTMPRVNLKILAFLCKHLHLLSKNSELNKMTASNLAIVFWPTLMRPPIMDLANPTKQLDWQKVMTTMIDRPGCIPDPDLEGAD
jgi:glucocorticoid receptor DNA-binding factor 1